MTYCLLLGKMPSVEILSLVYVFAETKISYRLFFTGKNLL